MIQSQLNEKIDIFFTYIPPKYNEILLKKSKTN